MPTCLECYYHGPPVSDFDARGLAEPRPCPHCIAVAGSPDFKPATTKEGILWPDPLGVRPARPADPVAPLTATAATPAAATS